jgi:hypothetical protein
LPATATVSTPTLRAAFNKVDGFDPSFVREAIKRYTEMKRLEFKCVHDQKIYLQQLTDMVVEDPKNRALKKYF